MAKSVLRLKVRKLRRQGKSINEIAKLTGASKYSVSLWCRDIELSEKQKRELWNKSKANSSGKFRAYCERKRKETKEKIEKLKKKGVETIGSLSERELFVAGVLLYWAEGFKTGHQVGFANSDPDMIKFFINWLTKYCSVSKNRLKARVGLNISHKNRISEIENYWGKVTGLSESQFNKPSYKKTKWKKKFENPEKYYGVLQIRVLKSADLLREICGHIEGLRNQAG